VRSAVIKISRDHGDTLFSWTKVWDPNTRISDVTNRDWTLSPAGANC
jgi:hypothetical protein